MKLGKALLFIALLIHIPAFAQQKLITYWNLAEHRVDKRDGGRANTVTVSPWHPNELFVASDSGGLFRSYDWGERWQHVDGLPVSATQSVIHLDIDTILVSAKEDFKTKNGGGVWRSDDNGASWTQVELPEPAVTKRISAYEISVSGIFIAVGTSEGIFLSSNSGASWEFASPFGADEHPEVYSVLVEPGRIYAGGLRGVRIGTVPLGSWTAPRVPPVGRIDTMHAFESSPLTAQQAFVATTFSLFMTTDRGVTWGQVAPAHPVCSTGVPFVEAARRNGVVDVFHSTGCQLFRITAPVVGTTPDFQLATRQELQVERADKLRDLVMFNEDPVLLATNGGIQDSNDHGDHWQFTGGGIIGGYNAYQIAEMKGQLIHSVEHTDLYVPTRDNGFWAAHVDGDVEVTLPVEAHFVEAERRLFIERDSRITWVRGINDTTSSTFHLLGDNGWSNPVHGQGAPVLIRHDQYVQQTESGLSFKPGIFSNWQPFAAFTEDQRGLPVLGKAGAGDHAIVYQTYRANLTGPPVDGATRLIRAQFSQGNGFAVYPGMLNFGGLGLRRTPNAVYPVYGVDSRNFLRLIAPDVINGRMMVSCSDGACNGGEEWTEIPGLTKLVTRDGDLLFQTDLSERFSSDTGAPLVTAVSFSPDNPQLVLAGTREGGIYMSGNRGQTWSRILNSERAGQATAFYWLDANTVFVSTWGRGLWKMRNVTVAVQDMFGELCGSCDLVSMDGDRPPAADGSVLVFDGEMIGVRREKGMLREVFVTPGSSVVFTGDEKDLQEDIAITRTTRPAEYEPLPKGPDGWVATGVVFTSGDVLTGAAYAKERLTLLPPEFDGDVKGSTESPSKGQPYIRLITSAFNGVATAAPEETFELSASDFPAGASCEVLIDGVPLKDEATADRGGAFTMKLTAPAEAGYHTVAVRMVKDGTVLDASTVLVR